MPHRCKGVSWTDGKTEFGGAQKNQKEPIQRDKLFNKRVIFYAIKLPVTHGG